MKNRLELILALAILAMTLACSGTGEPTAGQSRIPEEALQRAENAAQALGHDLAQHLVAELQAGGPDHAVQACSEVAQELAAAHSSDGLTVRRVSLKARNPAGHPDPFEREALLELERLDGIGRLPSELVEIETTEHGQQLRYVRPIVVSSTCLSCHGPAGSIGAEATRLIAERYPEDEATGYREGDLRGAISVTLRLD